MRITPLLISQEASLRKKIKAYQKVAAEIQDYLAKHPHEWGRFQSDFNMELNGIFRDIMDFEKQCLAEGDEASVYKLKRLFVNHLRKEFLHGECIVWSLNKPYGYAGDFKIIDDIYRNDPKTQGFDRLYDNYFQMSSISVAVRNRKEDFKRIVASYVDCQSPRPLLVMDLASGPCRDLWEMFSSGTMGGREIMFHCYEQDIEAIQYGRSLLKGYESRVTFLRENMVRFALKKNIQQQVSYRYDLIYATGLFDYFDRRAATRLLQNLRKVLNLTGIIAISDVRNKYQNPSVHFMEWVGDWNLVYRSDEEFRDIFLDSGFKADQLEAKSEQQGIMQYIIATNLE